MYSNKYTLSTLQTEIGVLDDRSIRGWTETGYVYSIFNTDITNTIHTILVRAGGEVGLQYRIFCSHSYLDY